MTVLSATTWRNNAEMIEDVVRLGYIRPEDDVLDLTYGGGKWWTNYRPANLTANVHPDVKVDELDPCGFTTWTCRDFANMGDIGPFDVVVFDPPYVSMGGRETSGMPDFMDRYGLREAPRTPADLHLHNEQGLVEARRIVKPGGFVLVKCADYISSGQLQLASSWMLDSALAMGFQVQDKLIHVGHVRPQPPGRRALHARQNASTLWVFRKPKRSASVFSTSDRKGAS